MFLKIVAPLALFLWLYYIIKFTPMIKNQHQSKSYNPTSTQLHYNSMEIRLSKSPPTKINSKPTSQKIRLVEQQESKGMHQADYQEYLFQRIVEIQKPQLIKEGFLTSYKLYKIKTKKSKSQFYDSIVNRRFNDFQFLHHQIVDNFGGYVIPKLPQKNFLAKLNLQTDNFVQIRTKELQKYLYRLVNHSKIRLSSQLRHFLFDQSYDFSFNKGEFSQQNTAIEGVKLITSSVFDITKNVYTKIMGKKERRCEFSKNNEEQMQLKLFDREVQDLMKVTKGISHFINQSFQEFSTIHQLSIISNRSHLEDLTLEQNYIQSYRQLIREFEDIANFVQNCKQAIIRTKNLRAQIQELQDQQAAIQMKERENPRNRQLDIIRSKIQKANTKCQKWISSLKKELSLYTHQGKTLMEDFVKKFTQLKAQIYASAQF